MSKPQTPSASANAPESFEAVLARLETVVDQLEGDDLALEDALKAYAEGVELARRGSGLLDGAERRIEELKVALNEDDA